MMRHDEYRELLALRLYGELDGEGREKLARHLTGCEACSDFAFDLERGLGRLAARPDDAFDDLPAGWKQRVTAAAIVDRPVRKLFLFPGWQVAAGFVLGLLAAGAFRGAPTAPVDGTTVVQRPGPRPDVREVPRSTGGPSPLARLAAQRRG